MMSVDLFGRQLTRIKSGGVSRGPPGEGFKLTEEGNYDIASKVLCNIADAQEKTDAVNLGTVERLVQRATHIIIEHFNPMIEELRRIKGEIDIAIVESLDPVETELTRTKNMLNDLASKYNFVANELKLSQKKVSELESRLMLHLLHKIESDSFKTPTKEVDQ